MKKEEYKKIFELETKHWWYLGMQKISQSLLSLVVKNRNSLQILDAGCGTGAMMIYLEQFGEVNGIDISPEALHFAKLRKLKNIHLASVEKILFQDRNFDLVTSFDVLYHQQIKNDFVALREFYRVLQPGGYLLIRVPAYNWLRGKHDEIVATRHRYTRNELVQKAKNVGFNIRRATYANMILFPIVLLRRFFEDLLSREETSDLRPLPRIINALLAKILYFEAFLITKIDLPLGLSLFILAQKPSLGTYPTK